MASSSNRKPVITQTPASTTGHIPAELTKTDFDAQIELHGYRVYIDRAIECPCKGGLNNSQTPSCRNCAGCGWVWLNRYETKLLLQSMGSNIRYKEWSQERSGQVKISARKEVDLGFMDKVTLKDGEAQYSQVIHPQEYYGQLICKTLYEPITIKEIYCFDTTETPLKKLVEGTDFTVVQGNFFLFNDSYRDWTNFTVSIKYSHRPQYYVVDFNREVMTTHNKVGTTTQYVQMPISAMGKRAHDILDEQSFTADYVLDNSYLTQCANLTKILPSPQNVYLSLEGNSVTILWSSTSSSGTFILERAFPNSNHFSALSSVPGNIRSFTDTVASGSVYFYRIAYREGGKQSVWSNIVGIYV